ASHAQIGVVAAAVDRQRARKRDLGNVVTRVSEQVGVTVGAGEAVLDVGRRRVFSIRQEFGKAGGAVAPRTNRRYFLVVVPLVERLGVAIEMTFPEFETDSRFRLFSRPDRPA